MDIQTISAYVATAPVATDFVGIPHPKYQVLREIEAIIRDPRLIEKLGNETVREIRKVDGGYLIVTDSCEMLVNVTYTHTEMFGGAPSFELTFNEPVWFLQEV